MNSELEQLIEQIIQFCAEYEKLCELHYTASDIDTKITLERQMRILRVSQLYPARNRINSVIHEMENDAQRRAWERVKDERNI